MEKFDVFERKVEEEKYAKLVNIFPSLFGKDNLVLHSDENIFIIEINNTRKELKEKNFDTICKVFFTGMINHGPKTYVINLNNFDVLKKGEFIYHSVLKEEKSLVKMNDNLEIIDINLDYLRKMDFEKLKKASDDSLERFLYILVCDDDEKLDIIYERFNVHKYLLSLVNWLSKKEKRQEKEKKLNYENIESIKKC